MHSVTLCSNKQATTSFTQFVYTTLTEHTYSLVANNLTQFIMKQGYRNAWFATIVTKFITIEELKKGFFNLDGKSIYILGEIAEAMKVKSTNGKSKARTLYDRAMAGITYINY